MKPVIMVNFEFIDCPNMDNSLLRLNTELFLVRVFLYSDWIRIDTQWVEINFSILRLVTALSSKD